jgi:hypothetical protein
MTRPAYALPNVSEDDVAAILKPIADRAEGLRSPHSIVTARDVLNRLWFDMHEAAEALSVLDRNATKERIAGMRHSQQGEFA